jgi:glycine cleavage system H protein
MSFPNDRKYMSSHEWAQVEGDLVVVGVSAYAQESLGDVIHIDLPSVGAQVKAGNAVAEIESVKAVSDIYTPVSGEVVAVNDGLEDSPELVNSDPHGAAWLFKVRAADLSDLDGLLDAEAYAAHVAAGGH